MKFKKLLSLLVIGLLLCGCKKDEVIEEKLVDEHSMKIVGEWLLGSDDYFEFFKDGSFERTCTNYMCSMVVRSNTTTNLYDTCVIKGTFELKDTKLHLKTTESSCNLEKEEFVYGFNNDLEYFCANENAVCSKGWEKSNDNPKHLNTDGTRLS